MMENLIPILSAKDQRKLRCLITLWGVTALISILWWLNPSHYTDFFKFSFNTLVVGWTILIPGYYFFFISRMKRANPALPIPEEWRIAMVVTRAPSEPFETVKKILLAMKAQKAPHDTWLADENPTPSILSWCKHYGVQVSTRKHDPSYHRDEWPRRKRCKEGNLAYFYDHYGYADYDFVMQMDSDHIPSMGYLEAMLRPFHDSKIGYVSAPSICDNNAKDSWTARGRLFLESHIHGSLQTGYNGPWTPMCIGSHYAIRTAALRESGGLGPELAEDHSTTLLLAAHGWQGIHAIDAEAHGDGPATFEDAMVQEFQWARSLVMIFLAWTPRYFNRLTPHLKFQFLFGQLWYFLFSGAMLSGFLLPPLSLIVGAPFARVSYSEFIFFSSLPVISSVLIIFWIKSRHLLRPVDARIINWEIPLFQLARWPWVIWAIVDATRCVVFKSKLDWKITPKVKGGYRTTSLAFFIPYFLIVFVSAAAMSSPFSENLQGYLVLTLINAISYLLLMVLIIVIQRQESITKI